MSEHVLITGASGFLGYHIVTAAVNKGLKVYAAVRKNSNIIHLKNLPVSWLYLDFDNVDDLSKQLADNDIEYIIHAAGITKAIRQDAYNYINATYTLNLAKAAERLPGGLKKFVFISSLAAIGPLDSEEGVLTELTLPKPVTAYGKSKLLAEQYLTTSTIPYTILRPTAIYGPRDKDIFIILKTVNKGLDPYIGKFSQRLSFVHAEDVAELAVTSLFNSTIGIYNITDGKSYTRYQFVDIAKKILNKNAFRFHLPMPFVKSLAYVLETTNGWLKKPSVISREKLAELAARNWICDVSKAQKELQFLPKYDLETGLQASIDWYQENKWL